jgi:hypothetical protein
MLVSFVHPDFERFQLKPYEETREQPGNITCNVVHHIRKAKINRFIDIDPEDVRYEVKTGTSYLFSVM